MQCPIFADIYAHLCYGVGAFGLPVWVHDLHNQSVLAGLPLKDCPSPVSVDLHGIEFIDQGDQLS